MISPADFSERRRSAVPFHELRQNLHGRGCDLETPGWRSDLIANDPQLFPFCGEAQNRQQEISTARSVDPRRPKYQVRHAGSADSLLTGEFSFSVNTNGVCSIEFFVSCSLPTVEDVAR